MVTEMTNAAPEADEVLCPACGYDLRGSMGGAVCRCPECGQQFDLASLSTSRIPWMHRREIGRLKAWWLTCWMVLRRPRDLAASLNAPMPYSDARRFWIVCATIASIPAIFVGWWAQSVAGTPIPELNIYSMGTSSLAPWWFVFNCYAPWAAGCYLMSVAVPCAVMVVFIATGGMSYLFQFAPRPRRLQDRAAAAGLYTSGAIVAGVVPALVLVALIIALILATSPSAWFVDWIPSGVLGFFSLVLLAWWFGVWQCYRRISRAGVVRSALVAGAIVAITLLAVFIGLCFIPWCVGVGRILLSAGET